MKWTFLLVAAASIVVLIIFPWGDFQGHTHWQKVAWIPFVSPPMRVFDIIANVALFAPLGAAVAGSVSTSGLPLLFAAVTGALLSLAGESAQLYSHTRFPSATDFVCNTTGALVGAILVRRKRNGVSPVRRTRSA